MKPLKPLAFLSAAVLLASCAQEPQTLGTAPSTPVSSDTNLANNGASKPDPGIKPGMAKMETGIDPYADKKINR